MIIHLNTFDPYISIVTSKLRFLSICQGEVSLNFLSAVYNYLKELRCKIYEGMMFLRYVCGHENLYSQVYAELNLLDLTF